MSVSKKKKSKVVLVVNEHNFLQEFTLAHAERILRMENNGGWQLPEDSEFTYTKENGINIKSDKGEISKTI